MSLPIDDRADPQTPFLGRARRILLSAQSAYLVATLGAKAVSLLALTVLASRIELKQFGLFTYLQATAMGFVALFGFSLETTVNVRVGQTTRAARDGALADSFAVTAIGLLGAAVGLFALPLFAARVVTDDATAVGGIAATVALLIAGSWLNGLCFARRRYAAVAVFNLLYSVLILVVAVRASRTATAPGLFIGFAVSLLVANVAQGLVLLHLERSAVKPLAVLRRIRPSAGGAGVLVMARFGLQQGAIGLMGAVGIWLLQQALIETRGLEENGVFGFASIVFTIIITVPAVVSPLIVADYGKAADGAALRSRAVAWFRAAGLGGLAVSAIALAAAAIASHLLPAAQLRFVLPALLSAAAALLLVVKAPISTYYNVALKGWPDLIAAGGSLLLIVLVVRVHGVSSALEATGMRAAANALAVAGVLSFFFKTRSAADTRRHRP